MKLCNRASLAPCGLGLACLSAGDPAGPLNGGSLRGAEELLERTCSNHSYLVRSINPRFFEILKLKSTDFKVKKDKIFFRDLTFTGQYKVVMYDLRFLNHKRSENGRVLSAHFRKRLSEILRKENISELERWFQTTNGILLPYLLQQDLYNWKVIDELKLFALENCANNYADFISKMKTGKKLFRKWIALGAHGHFRPHPMVRTYFRYAEDAWVATHGLSVQFRVQIFMLWTQTRASGIADGAMIRTSITKFLTTVTTVVEEIPMDFHRVMDITKFARNSTGARAKVSCGPSSCMESTREDGGQLAYLKLLCKQKILVRRYDWGDLSVTEELKEALPIRSPSDLMDWAIDIALNMPYYIRSVRIHAVAEPSKARVITIAPYAYLVIMNFFGHLWTKDIVGAHLRSGLRADRHLWSFMKKTMDNDSTSWSHLTNGEVWGLSTDLEEATDYGNPTVARKIWHGLILQGMTTLGFPLGLATLAKTLFCGKRYILHKGEIITKNRGWFMGDPMTKCILTLAQDYCYRMIAPQVAPGSVVGDDLIRLSSDRALLETIVPELEALDFKVSRDDTFISKFFVFFCEEISLIPQRPSDCIAVAYRRGKPLGYVDYPRIRLLLDTKTEMNRQSYTRTGRYLLLGKEQRWVRILSPLLSSVYHRASVWQHLLLPVDPTMFGRYLPMCVGGDDHRPPSVDFARKMWDNHPQRREIYFRLQKLLTSDFPARYLRSEYTHGVYAYHLWLPKVECLREIIPEDWVIEPRDDIERDLISSLKGHQIVSPVTAIQTIAGSLFYRDVLRGKDPAQIEFKLDLEVGHSDVQLTDLDIEYLLNTWDNPGFFPKNREPYLIKGWLLDTKNYLNYGLQYVTSCGIDPQDDEFKTLLSSEEDRFLPMVRSMVLQGQHNLPERVMQRLYMYVESDNLLLSIARSWDPVPDRVNIVTRDIRLARRISLLNNFRRKNHLIVIVPPELYLMGRHYDLDGRIINGIRFFADAETLVDPGAIAWADRAYFQDGMAPDDFWGELTIDMVEFSIAMIEIATYFRREHSFRKSYELLRDNLVDSEFYEFGGEDFDLKD